MISIPYSATALEIVVDCLLTDLGVSLGLLLLPGVDLLLCTRREAFRSETVERHLQLRRGAAHSRVASSKEAGCCWSDMVCWEVIWWDRWMRRIGRGQKERESPVGTISARTD